MKIISVDFQKDFTDAKGFAYKPRESVKFIKSTLIPFLNRNKIKIAEIISDYRPIPNQAPLSNRGFFCVPGTDGFKSEIPANVKLKNIWIKCMHSPLWIRKNIGKTNKILGKPYQDVKLFTKWLDSTIGSNKKDIEIILIGLTGNCCILCLAQELYFRGYIVKILAEATDDYSGNEQDKDYTFKLIENNKWAKIIHWSELKINLEKNGK